MQNIIKMRIVATMMYAVIGLGLSAREKCKVVITAAEGARPYELVVGKASVDPKDSPLRTTLEEDIYECEIEADEIEKWSVVDFGEIMATGNTSRLVDFFVEDGATVRIYFDGEQLTAISDGAEFQLTQRMEQELDEYAERLLEGLDPKALNEEQQADLMVKYRQYQLDYYASHPMLSFLLDLANDLSSYHLTMQHLGARLDIYHKYYENLFPKHSAHAAIALGEKAGYQIVGRPYNDYAAYTVDGSVAKASDYFAGKPTLVICWASWCAPCHATALQLIPIYEQYRQRGLNVFSVAREFETPDKFKEDVAADQYPWTCLYDLDDTLGVFRSHGTSSSGLYVIDADGTLVATGYDWSDIEAAVDSLLP